MPRLYIFKFPHSQIDNYNIIGRCPMLLMSGFQPSGFGKAESLQIISVGHRPMRYKRFGENTRTFCIFRVQTLRATSPKSD